MALLETLYVNILAKTDKFVRQMKNTENAVASVKSKIINIAAAVSGLRFFQGISVDIDEMDRLSRRLDIPYNALEDLKYIAYQSDVAFATLARGMSEFGKKMGELKSGEKISKDLASTFNEMGINVNAIINESTQKRLMKLVEGFDRLGDADKKIAAAQTLFGKSGKEMVDVMILNRFEVRNLLRDRERMLRLQEDEIESNRSFITTLKSLWTNIKSVGGVIWSVMSPALTLLADGMNRLVTRTGLLIEMFGSFVNSTLANIFLFLQEISVGGVSRTFKELEDKYRAKQVVNETKMLSLDKYLRESLNEIPVKGYKSNGIGKNNSNNLNSEIGTTAARAIDWRNMQPAGVAGVKKNEVSDTKAQELLKGIRKGVDNWGHALGKGSVGSTVE